MKSILSLAICLVTLFSFSQTIEPLDVQIFNDLNSTQNNLSLEKSAICGVDTVEYTLAKATALDAITINNATSAQAIGQYFNAPQPITVSGLDFFGWKMDTTGGITIDVTVEMFLAGADSLPTGAALATTSVTVDTTFGGGSLTALRKTTSFTPVTVSQPYIMVVTNNAPNSVAYIINSYADGDGMGEWLSSVNLFGTWTHSYDVNLGGLVFDADMLSYPHVTYGLAADFSILDDCLTTGTTSFTNGSSPVISDRMYNIAAFQAIEAFSYNWDYDDGSAIENEINPSHTFPSSGYNAMITLSDTLYGWKTTCFADTTIAIGDSIESIWSSSVNSLDVDFTDLSFSTSSVTNYSWDFGDGNTSILQDPSHTYLAAGTYGVCLEVTNTCGFSDSTCQMVVITSCSNPVASFTVSGTEPDFVFTNTSTTTGSTVTYSWDMGDGTTYTTEDVTHSYAANGVFPVVLVVTDSCGTNTYIEDVTVTSICSNPVASFTVSGTEPDFVFTNTSTTTGSTVTYSWDMGDGTTYTTEDVTHSYGANGVFPVILVVTDSCGTNTFILDVTITTMGIDEMESLNLLVYPVPASDELRVESVNEIESIEFYDLMGRLVFNNNVNSTTGVLSIIDLAEGEYLLKVNLLDGMSAVKRIAIVH